MVHDVPARDCSSRFVDSDGTPAHTVQSLRQSTAGGNGNRVQFEVSHLAIKRFCTNLLAEVNRICINCTVRKSLPSRITRREPKSFKSQAFGKDLASFYPESWLVSYAKNWEGSDRVVALISNNSTSCIQWRCWRRREGEHILCYLRFLDLHYPKRPPSSPRRPS